MIFWLIAVGDYVDGFLARATGQYSRMGSILDPIVDRLTILSGVVVCWHFELLPRWALAVLVGREVITALLAEFALRRVGELQINWLGRLAIGARDGVDLLLHGLRELGVERDADLRGRARGDGYDRLRPDRAPRARRCSGTMQALDRTFNPRLR